jgi:HlyD family secretion protein
MKVRCFFFLLLIFCFFSCKDKRLAGIITYQLKRSDYIEKITVAGTIQAVTNTPVMPPRTSSSQMTVIRLAKDGSYVRKGDTLCVLSVPELVTMDKEALTSIENLEADLKKAEADNKLNIALLEAQVATSQAQMKISSLDSLKMKFATDVNKRLMELEMKKAIIERKKIERKLATTKIAGSTDIMQKKARIMQEKMREQTYADQIKSLTLIAQRDGMVMRTEAPRITVISSAGGSGSYGGPVREGSVLFIITTAVLQFPDLSRMQISADVSEADFKRIEKGQKVNIIVSAANKLVTTGKINRKNLAPSQAMRNLSQKVKFFEVIIDVDSCHSEMKPGLSANCEIILKQEKDNVSVPSLAIFEKDSNRIVYVREKMEFRQVKVKTGIAGSSYTIIKDGLRGDEIIALSEPPNSLIIKESDGKDSVKIQKQ